MKFCCNRVVSLKPLPTSSKSCCEWFLVNVLGDYFWTVILSNAGGFVFGKLESPFSYLFDNILLYMAGALLGGGEKETNCGKLQVSEDSF